MVGGEKKTHGNRNGPFNCILVAEKRITEFEFE